MHTPEVFGDLLIILLVAVPVAFASLRVKLPVLVGLILSGIAIGPYGLGWIHGIEAIEILAEIGVMLLLFTIGLEFSLRRLAEMKRLVLLGGGLQVVLTVALTAAAAIAIFGRPVTQAMFFGCLVALSSTAIVLKSYVDRNELDSPHGRAGIAILLFQDISIVFMLLAVPLLGGANVSMSSAIVTLLSSLGILALLVLSAWFFLPKFLKAVVGLRSPEAFLLTVVLLCLGMSWVTQQLGLSLALGAFIAGMVLADTDYSHQVTSEVLPFRDVFNSLFFVSIGMLLSISDLIQNLLPVVVLVAVLILVKALIIWMVIRIIGYAQRVAVVTAVGLAQIGEFSFVLAKTGQDWNLLPGSDYQIFLAASIISMIATPFLITLAPRIGYWMQNLLKDQKERFVDDAEEDIHMTSTGGLQQHVIIVGYGLNGKNLARVLRSVGVSYSILDLNSEIVKRAKAKGEKINFGDSTRREVLLHAGIDSAWSLVLAMSDAQAARRTVAQARQLNPNVHIIVRTRYVSEINELYDLGANEVIPEEFETSIEIFSRVLHRHGVSRTVIESQIEKIRSQGYEILRSTNLPAVAAGVPAGAIDSASTDMVRLEASSPVVGKSLGDVNLRGESGATAIAVIREGITKISPGANYQLREGDTIVLLGSAEKIERAKNLILPEIPIGGYNA